MEVQEIVLEIKETDIKEHHERTINRPEQIIKMLAAGIFCSLIVVFFIVIFSQPLKDILFFTFKNPTNVSISDDDGEKIKKDYEGRIAKLKWTLQKNNPKEAYLIINTTENSYSLVNNEQVLREGICSTGSYVLLETDNKKWLFKTPRGMHKILGKVKNPIWRKPDWAFVEDGLPIPSGTSQLRYESGVLGSYAMSLGQGYMIHGTLYKRQLGMPVTHGCIRLADDDLEAVFNALKVGSRVFIF